MESSEELKKGDWVVCVDAVDCLDLEAGRFYQVVDPDNGYGYVLLDNPACKSCPDNRECGGWMRRRFKKVGTEQKPANLTLPTDSKARKDCPVVSGFIDYFPAAVVAVAQVSKAGNDKHNPGQPMHHARGKSTDHADCILRHLMDRGTVDPEDGLRHSAKVAWRALALLQEELEVAGLAPLARGAKLPAVGTK